MQGSKNTLNIYKNGPLTIFNLFLIDQDFLNIDSPHKCPKNRILLTSWIPGFDTDWAFACCGHLLTPLE